eukprot:c16177_g1_i1.p1 GENE.c16177_g1_i1~~c16177_g1_i1.p1  ORF type:complete len:412 (-),score=162.45 c16177_g1_i1:56-1291(-)
MEIMFVLFLCFVTFFLTDSKEISISDYINGMKKVYPKGQKQNISTFVAEPKFVSFLEEKTYSTTLIGSKTKSSSTTNTMLTVAFCRSDIHHEIHQRIRKDIGEMHSVEATTQVISSSVSFFNDAFIKPFVDMLSKFMVPPLIMAFQDVLPWYLTGPIASTLSCMSPKPVVQSIDAMLGMYMPPLICISITKKLVKGLILVLTAAIVSIIERARSGHSAGLQAGDGGGTQKVVSREISRRLGIDITNHLIDTVPRAAERALTHTLSSSLTTSVQLYYYCTYCYWFGDYCKLCFYLPDYTWKEGEWWRKQRKIHSDDRHFMENMNEDAKKDMASLGKPLSPITAPPATAEAFKQNLNNEMAIERRTDRVQQKGEKALNKYLKRLDKKIPGRETHIPEKSTESTVETEDGDINI